MVKLTDHKSLSHETVRRRVVENDLKPWRKDMWCIPQVDGEYVARMEDVLDLYAEVPDPKRPAVCFDESPVQLICKSLDLIWQFGWDWWANEPAAIESRITQSAAHLHPDLVIG
jgi:hypothetical protein